jgi:hypothetical protein
MVDQLQKPAGDGLIKKLVRDRLAKEARNLATAAGQRAVSSVGDRMTSAAGRLTEYAAKGRGSGDGPGLIKTVTGGGGDDGGDGGDGGGGGPLKGLKKLFGGGKGGGKGGGGGRKIKVTNIVEQLDVGAPISLCYNQWTQFAQFPTFMKKVENVDQQSDEKLHWKAQIFWSHRTWESTIVTQIPDERIVWRSKGAKGSVDGAVSFHELGPNLTRIMLVLEYHPQGLFEKTGNIWRAQGRRARLEFKHFARHVMTQAILKPEDVKGWRGEIRDSKVVSTGESDKDQENGQKQGDRQPEHRGKTGDNGQKQGDRQPERRGKTGANGQTQDATDKARQAKKPKKQEAGVR